MHTRIPALLLASVLVFLGGCAELQHPSAPEDTGDAFSLSAAAARGSAGVIVTLPPGVDPGLVAASHGLEPRYVYTHVMNGFAASVPEATLRGLLADGRVRRLEHDGLAYFEETVQENAIWGLDRIDQRALPLDGRYGYGLTGRNITVYIMDTGIRFSHEEFEGRAVLGHDFALEDDPESTDPNQGPGEDCYGHGTTVAGTVGGRTFGVAKQARLVAVRMTGCVGFFPISRGLAALDWMMADHLERTALDPQTGSVVNMSFGSDFSEAFDDAVRALIASGVAAAVSAGNHNLEDEACRRSPARIAEAMTTGASDRYDERSHFSNWGACVDWFAPGTGILSAAHTGDTDVRLASGTSLSAPHVAGVAALYLEANPDASAAMVFAGLAGWNTKGAIRTGEEPVYHHRNGRLIGYADTFGDLLYSRVDLADEPVSVGPTASFGYDCANSATCSFTSTSTPGSTALAQWDWSSSAGHVSTGATTALTFTAAGSYTVTHVVTDANGRSDEAMAVLTCQTHRVHGVRCK
jgi:subtilisin family serine protease